MTTSSDNRTPAVPRPDGQHWEELTRRLPESIQHLDAWFDGQLAVLEKKQARFITQRSLKKSLRR